MGELERNMRDDVGQPQGNAPSADSRRQMDMFEDERRRVSHRRGAIARGVAKRGLVAFLAFAMAFGATPAQLWAEGTEGIAEAVAQAATPAEGTVAVDGAADGVVSEIGSNASPSYKEITGSVASLRLDAMISLAFGESRSHSVSAIEGGLVFVNGKLVTTNAYNLKEGEIISVRGKGRFRYMYTKSETKKGRYMVVLNLYV